LFLKPETGLPSAPHDELPGLCGLITNDTGSCLERVAPPDDKINGILFEFITEGPTWSLRFLWHNDLLKGFFSILPESTSHGLPQPSLGNKARIHRTEPHC